MKNNKIKTVFFSLIIMMSLSSYVFLNSLSVPTPTSESSLKIEEVGMNDLTTKNEATLPDVQIVKHGVEMMKKMLPIPQ